MNTGARLQPMGKENYDTVICPREHEKQYFALPQKTNMDRFEDCQNILGFPVQVETQEVACLLTTCPLFKERRLYVVRFLTTNEEILEELTYEK